MSIGAFARGLATASMVAMAVAGYQAAPAHTAKRNPQNKSASTCLAQGYQWDDVKGCADKKCDTPEASEYHGVYYFGLHNASAPAN